MTNREFKLKCYQIAIAFRVLDNEHSNILNQSEAFRFLADSIEPDEFDEEVALSLVRTYDNAKNYLEGYIRAMDLGQMESCEMMFAISAVLGERDTLVNLLNLFNKCFSRS